MNFVRVNHRQLIWFLLSLAVPLVGPIGAFAESTGSVSVGIDGHCRIGRWTGIRYSGSDKISAIETRDGDGVRVVYQPHDDSDWAYVIPGSEAAPLVLRSEDTEVLSTRFPTVGSPARGAAMIAREMRWVVTLGDPLGIDSIGANKLLDRDAKIAVTKPKDPSSLPDSTLGYDGVDMMVISGSSVQLLRELNEQQRSAIGGWIAGGGYVFLTLGESAKSLSEAAPWLLDLVPLEQIEPVEINPSALETFTSTQTPLQSFAGVRLAKDAGRVMVRGRTTRRVSTPLAVEYNTGFGRIVVVAADLETEMFANWPERLDLITQLTGSMLIPESAQRTTGNRSTAYDDLAGQLRASLDQFKSQRNIGFSIVSLILIVLIALIGPLDYLLINRVFGRPLLGWISFPLIAIGFSAVLVMQSRPSPSPSASSSETEKLADLETNQVEIFDIDTIEGVGRGLSTRYFYSHDARRIDVDVIAAPTLVSINDEIQTMVTAPFGNPGLAFGGIPISVEDARLPAYEIPFKQIDSITSSTMVGLPIASRSSKGIVSRCRFTPKMAREVSLRRRPGSELLEGEFTNPLPFDLLSGTLVFRNWAYRLPTRFPVGGHVATVATLQQKNFRWQLSRQTALEESKTQTEAWDPTEIDSLERVAEMLMFHDAAGGSRYTSLRDDPLSELDFSHLLSDDRCVLIGRLAEPLTTCQVTTEFSDEQLSSDQEIGQTLSLIRVVLPVNDGRRR